MKDLLVMQQKEIFYASIISLLGYYVNRRQHTSEVSTKKQDVASESNQTLTTFSQGIFCEDEDKWQPKIFS